MAGQRIRVIERRAGLVVPALMVLLACLTLVVPVLPPASSPAAADAACDKYADPNGNDANVGTLAQPKRSPMVLLDALAPGEEGCLTDGATFTFDAGAAQTSATGSPGSPKVLRPTTPGARVTMIASTGFAVRTSAHDLVFRDIDFRTTQVSGNMVQINGDRITLEGVDLTYPNNICLGVGVQEDPAEDFTLRQSAVHGCGRAYGDPRGGEDRYGGLHGVYLAYLRDGADPDGYSAVIEQNFVYDNNNRGVQLYPDADDVLLQFNLLYGNGSNLNLGGDSAALLSQRNLVTNNILADSVLPALDQDPQHPELYTGWLGDTHEVLGRPSSTAGNHVDGNCISNSAHPQNLYDGVGFTHVDNIENQDPLFTDAAANDFALRPGSPCAGKGPSSIQPNPSLPPAPTFVREWGNTSADTCQLDGPESIDASADGRRIYVAATNFNCVMEFDARGRPVRHWGAFGTGAGHFDRPVDLAVAPDNGDVYVADLQNNRIQQFNGDGVFIRQWGSPGSGAGQFNQPHGIAVDGSYVYVADLMNHRIQRFTRAGAYVQSIGSGPGSGPEQFNRPAGVAVDPWDGRIYVADLLNRRIQYFNSTGGGEGSWGTQGTGSGQFELPVDVAVGRNDFGPATSPNRHVFVTDYGSHRIQRFERPDVFSAPGVVQSWSSGPAELGPFLNPESLAVVGAPTGWSDSPGQTLLYVADGGNDRIQVFGPALPTTGIRGSVFTEGTSDPIPGAAVAVLRTSDFVDVAGAVADTAGDFSVAVPPGSYFLYVVDPAGHHTAGFSPLPPTSVTVVDGQLSNVNPQRPTTRGAIAGSVTADGTGAALPGAVAITLDGTTSQPGRGDFVDNSGSYRIPGLTPGNHRIGFVDLTGARTPEFHANAPAVPGSSLVGVTAGATTTVDAGLAARVAPGTGAILQGTVTDESTGDALPDVVVVALRAADYSFARAAVTDANGHYALDLVADGYKLEFVDPTGLHHMEWHPNLPYYEIASAATAPAPGGFNASLAPTTGSIAGTVEHAGQSVGGAWVVAIAASGAVRFTTTDGLGNFRIDDLTPGTYRATFLMPGSGVPQEYWQDSADFAGATPFNVAAGQVTTIDPTL